MGRINVLSFAVANLIAAGEVVDRPSSVIKELLENAIDSGADRITVEIQNGGITYMRVCDNGCGMTSEELPVAIRRHATSKIKDAEDLDGILTLGFRGEALAAISSVSDLRIISKTKDSPTGAMLTAEAGNIISVEERACADGTTVIVENLFRTVPARRKFLKKDVTETAAVCAMVEKIALSKPHIAFKLIVDGEVKRQTMGDGKLKNTIYSLFGRDFASKILETSIELDGIKVSGYVGTPTNVRANRNYQNFFINGRYVKTQTALAAIEQAYTSYIASDKFPCCVLFIEINPSTVDVNVHPTKLEVKFSNEKPVFEAIFYAVRNALEKDTSRPSVTLSAPTAPKRPENTVRVSDMSIPITDGRAQSLAQRQLKTELYTGNTSEEPKKDGGFLKITAEEYVQHFVMGKKWESEPKVELKPEHKPEVKTQSRTELPPVPPTPVVKPENIDIKQEELQRIEQVQKQAPVQTEKPQERKQPRSLEYRIIGEAFNSYVLVEREDTLLLIDKHAAHERIIFEQLKAGMSERDSRSSQLLMLPLEIMMRSDEIQIISQYREEIEAIGFEFDLGRYTVNVTAIPEGISTDAVSDMLTVMAERIMSNTGSAKLTKDIIFEKALYQASCKAAIKAGREYPKEYTEWVVDKLMLLPDITVCPHGRPVAMELSKKNLDYQFERS